MEGAGAGVPVCLPDGTWEPVGDRDSAGEGEVASGGAGGEKIVAGVGASTGA